MSYFKNKSAIFYDLINHGRSIGNYKDLSFEIYSNQLLNLVNELQIKKINIVGFSIGALVAQHFTEKFYEKVNKLVLIGSVYKRSSKQIETVQKRYSEALNGASITNNSIERWFSESYLKNNPQVYNFLGKLRQNKFLKLWQHIVVHRGNEIAYIYGEREKPDYLGKLYRKIFEPVCWILGKFCKETDWSVLYQKKEI